MSDLICPVHHIALELSKIEQGDVLLGYLYICPLGEWGRLYNGEDDCDECVDADMNGQPMVEEYKQLGLLEE